MKNELYISIIIPVYNVENYIERCLKSVLNQSYKNLEIILVDDGSTDNCPRICDEYEKKDSRIRVIHKKNGGLSDARNVGCQYAKGDFVWYVDSDDEIISTAVQELVDTINKYNADIVCFNFKEIIEETQKEFQNCFYTYTSSKSITELSYKEAISNNIHRTSIRYEATSKIYRMSIARQVIFPTGKLAEDFATFYKFLKLAKKIIYYDNQLYIYFKKSNSIMGNKSEKLYIDIYNTEIEYYNEIKKLNLNENDKRKAEDNYFKTLIKTYSKIYEGKNNNLKIDIEQRISDIIFKYLCKKSKILYICFKVNHYILVIIMKKMYKKL